MSNPYESPPAVAQSEIASVALWRRAVGLLCMVSSLAATLYGMLLGVMAVFSLVGQIAGPLPPFLFIFLAALIVVFGLGMGLFGIGIWTGKGHLQRRGGAMVGLSFLVYVGAALMFA